MRNTQTPDPARYIRENGNGIEDDGISRAVNLLPAMLAIGDPDGTAKLDPYDLADVRSVLEAYRDDGVLCAAGVTNSMFCNSGSLFKAGIPALDRLQGQPGPNGVSKARAAVQAIPLAMTPSRDLAHEGFWHLLADTATVRNMEAFTDGAAAGRSMQEALDFDKGTGLDGMAKKMAACWRGLDKAAAFSLKGAENSGRMMEYCAMQNLAYLDGYDLAPDDHTAREIGWALAGGIEDLDAFRGLMAKSLIQHEQPEAQKGAPEKTDRPSPMERMKSRLLRRSERDAANSYDGPEV